MYKIQELQLHFNKIKLGRKRKHVIDRIWGNSKTK